MAEATSESVIPVVDLAPFFGQDGAARRAVAREFGRAFEEVGFVSIVNHGVPAELVDGTYAAAQSFFGLPMEGKTRYTPPEQTKGRGYLPLGIESVAATLTGETPPDLCEALVFASVARERAGEGMPNYWPADPPQLADRVNAYHDAMQQLGWDLMRLSALALDLPEDWFAPHYRTGALVLRFVCYPEQTETPKDGQLRYGAHHDYGGLTILRQDDAPGGLQVCDLQGRWHDVPYRPGSFVINVGDLMARWTNDRWRSTLHRVVNPPVAVVGTRRLSMVAFTGPDATTEVTCLPSCVSAETPARYAPVNAQAYVMEKLRASMELEKKAA